MRRICLRTLLCAALIAPATLLHAQLGRQLADSLRAAMAHADSGGDRQAAFDVRIQLALQDGRSGAFALLAQAAALADSMQRPDLGALAHHLLAKRHAGGGAYAMAYSEAVIADSLDRVREMQELQRLEAEQAVVQKHLAAERDSIAQAAQAREHAQEQTIADVLRRSGSWMIAAFAALLTGVLLVLMLFYRMGRITGRMRATIEELRREVEVLKHAGPRAVPVEAEKPEPPMAHPVDEAMKPVVAGMFRKDAPERLTTLRDARLRGDNDKVLRVVASLKPQLLSFDADRFAPLITRLKAPGAAADRQQWNTDLDALETGLAELLGASNKPADPAS